MVLVSRYAGSGGVDPVKEANEALTQVISCLAISDRLVWMAASLQIGILAKQDCLKVLIGRHCKSSIVFSTRTRTDLWCS